MTNGVLRKLLSDRHDAQADKRSEDYAMVNVRPGEKVAAMLELLSKISGKSPSALVTDELSRRLAKFAASSSDNTAALLDAVEAVFTQDTALGFQAGSALQILEKEEILSIEFPEAKRLGKIRK